MLVKEKLKIKRLSGLGPLPAQVSAQYAPPPAPSSHPCSSVLGNQLSTREGGTEYRISAQEKERFFIAPKHDFCNLPSRYYGYHMTSELVSTETAIVGADKPQICPGAFINNKKRWPSVKNTPTRGRLFFPHYFFLCAHEHSNWGHGTGSAMENG